MPASPVLRPATLADAEKIAALHAAVWHQTYRELATPAAIAALTEARRRQHWQTTLASEDPVRLTLVAEHAAAIIGFVQAAPSQEPLFAERMEIKYLYVDQAQARRGLGRLLLTTIAGWLSERGHHAMALGVVAGNEAAIRFYQAMGGRQIGSYTDPGPLWRSENLLYAWDDLARLVAPQSVG